MKTQNTPVEQKLVRGPAEFLVTLENLEIPIHLGVSNEERSHPQVVRFEISFSLSTRESPYLETDEIEDGAKCYDHLSSQIVKFFENREARLIEKVAYDSYLLLKGLLPSSSLLCVRASKLRPPTLAKLGQVNACFSDFKFGGP